MTILLSDTSALLNLERGALVPCVFRLSVRAAVPDLLFERELRAYGGEKLLELGLRVESLDGAGVALAMRHRRRQRHLTVLDSFALSLAQLNSWTLLAGDGPLQELAMAENIACRDVLWLLDEFETQGAATYRQLYGGLGKIAADPRCRILKREIAARLSRYAERL
jgi:hypothetical protein